MKPPKNICVYPKKVWIKNECYRVVFSKSIKHYGETDALSKTIRIRFGMSPRETMRTFIHECLHAMDFENPKLKLKHKQVYALEEAIYEFLYDNF